MRKNVPSIPVNYIAEGSDDGISIERLSLSAFDATTLNESHEAKQAHREERHSFFLLEAGRVVIEIDFKEVLIVAPSVVYMHPDQVHRVVRLENMTVSVLTITNENLNPEYLKMLDSLTPAKPIALQPDTFSVITEVVSLCIKLADRKEDRLHHSQLKDSCNALVALVVSQYLALARPTDTAGRFKHIADAFKSLLESSYKDMKSPAIYAQQLNISAPYLNECVKNATGYPVSYHIQQRIILEAKRLLYHSDRSAKEIAFELGYDDYTYFSKLFTKAVGVTPLAFRKKNHE